MFITGGAWVSFITEFCLHSWHLGKMLFMAQGIFHCKHVSGHWQLTPVGFNGAPTALVMTNWQHCYYACQQH